MINIIAATMELDAQSTKDIETELNTLSGKFAGTCYAKDGYEAIRTQSIDKAINRAEMTKKSGHHSVFGHCSITMEINCSKIVAMLLNSIRVSNTSEKSARYTKMIPETKKELELYNKWHDIFVDMIVKEYPKKFSDKEVDKLAYENARYMISVFTPTSMVYTLPFRNLFYVYDWTIKMIQNLEKLSGTFNNRLKLELIELSKDIKSIIGDNTYFHDNKNLNFEFMPYQATGEEYYAAHDYYGDVYVTTYYASFAAIANLMRHRTLKYKINFVGFGTEAYGYYIPELVKKNKLTEEWKKDIRSVSNVYPQGTLVSVVESGAFEDFVLKCKERMCGRVQLEVLKITSETIKKFSTNERNLSYTNRNLLSNIVIEDNDTEEKEPCARCSYKDFNCAEGCKWGAKEALTRLI